MARLVLEVREGELVEQFGEVFGEHERAEPEGIAAADAMMTSAVIKSKKKTLNSGGRTAAPPPLPGSRAGVWYSGFCALASP